MTGLQYVSWVLSMATEKTRAQLSPALFTVVVKFLGVQAKQAKEPAAQLGALLHGQIRGLTYNVLAQISSHACGSALFNQNLKMMTLYFTALADETEQGAAQNIVEGISLLRQAYMRASGGVLQELKNWANAFVVHPNKRVRLGRKRR